MGVLLFQNCFRTFFENSNMQIGDVVFCEIMVKMDQCLQEYLNGDYKL